MCQFAFFYVQAPIQKFVEERILQQKINFLWISINQLDEDVPLLVLVRSYILDGNRPSRLQARLSTKSKPAVVRLKTNFLSLNSELKKPFSTPKMDFSGQCMTKYGPEKSFGFYFPKKSFVRAMCRFKNDFSVVNGAPKPTDPQK